ncbi:MAG: hypothetical protein ABIF71_11810, partial [Planctomycetota bacterium]
HHSAPHAKWIGYLFTGTNHPNRPMVDSRAWLTPKSAKAFSAGIRKSAVIYYRRVKLNYASGTTQNGCQGTVRNYVSPAGHCKQKGDGYQRGYGRNMRTMGSRVMP